MGEGAFGAAHSARSVHYSFSKPCLSLTSQKSYIHLRNAVRAFIAFTLSLLPSHSAMKVRLSNADATAA